MKLSKLLYATLAILPLVACEVEQEEIFSESASERVEQKILETRKVLASAENGWLVRMYTGPNKDFGGYNMIMKFDENGSVTMSSEVNPTKEATSGYTTRQSSGIVLSFNEKNEVLNYFTSPVNPDGLGKIGKGMQGDMEYRVKRCDKDTVELLGLKHNELVVCTPMDKTTSWVDYYTSLDAMKDKTRYSIYEFKVDTFIAKVTIANRNMNVEYIKDGQSQVDIYPLIPTLKGFSLFTPMKYGEKEVTDFIFADNNEFTTNIPEASLRGIILPLSDVIAEGEWNVAKKSFKMNVGMTKGVEVVSRFGPFRGMSYGKMSGQNAIICSFGSYVARTTVVFTKVDDNTIKVELGDSQDDNFQYILPRSPVDFLKLFTLMTGEFTLSSDDDLRNPKSIKLTNKADENIWFVVNR